MTSTRDKVRPLLRHLREIAATLAFQSGLQGLAVATGLVIIHAISKEEYGLYAIVASIQGMASVLTDSGIGSAVQAALGKASHDRNTNLGVILTALKERQRLLAGVLPICILLMIVLTGGKTSWPTLLVMELAMVICVYFEVSTFLYQIVPVYTGRRDELQTLQIFLSVGRVLAVVAFAVFYRITLIDLLAINVFYYFASLCLIRRLVMGKEPPKPIFDPELRRIIHRNIVVMLPNAAFYAFQDQITTYIISLFGTLVDVASVVALGRIGLLFSLLLNVIGMLGGPAFSKATTKAEGLRIFWTVMGLIALFAFAFFGASLLVPGLMLQILGKSYASLTSELQITVIMTGLTALNTGLWVLMTSRGLVRLGWVPVLTTIAAQFTYAAFGDVHTIRGVLWLGVVTAAADLLNMMVQAYWFILRPKVLGRN